MERPVRIANGTIIDAAYVESIDIADALRGDGTMSVVAYMHNGHRHCLEILPPGEPSEDSLRRWAGILRTGPIQGDVRGETRG
jgi:hypothetical protein